MNQIAMAPRLSGLQVMCLATNLGAWLKTQVHDFVQAQLLK